MWRVIPNMLRMLPGRCVQRRHVMTQEALQHRLDALITGHNMCVVDRWAIRSCALGCALCGIATTLTGNAIGLGATVIASLATLWVAWTPRGMVLHHAIANRLVTMPPPALINLAHENDKELALKSLIVFVITYPDAAKQSDAWWAEVMHNWPASMKSAHASADTAGRKHDEE